MMGTRNLSFLMQDPDANTKLLALCGLVILFITAAYISLVGIGGSYTSKWLIDVMGLVSGAYRVSSGQFPSIDFHSGLGLGVFYAPALGLAAGLPPGSILAFGQVLVAAILLPAAAVVCRSRFSLVPAGVFVIFTGLLLTAPMSLGDSPFENTFGVYYSRQDWAALSILLLLYVEPRQATRATYWQDTGATTVIVLFLLSTLINYAAVGLAFLCANAIFSGYNRRLGVTSLVLAGAALGIVELSTGYVSAFLADLQSMIGRKSSTLGGIANLRDAIELIHDTWLSVTVPLMAFIALICAGRQRFLDIAFLLGVYVVAVILGVQTESGSAGVPALIAILVCFGELARRERSRISADATDHKEASMAPALVILGFLVLFAAKPSIEGTFSIYHHHEMFQRMALVSGQESLPKLSGFRVAPNNSPSLHEMLGHSNERHSQLADIRRTLGDELALEDYMTSIVEGVKLLEVSVQMCQSIVVFDAVDPFSMPLGLKPTTAGYPLFWIGTTFSLESHPTPEQFFSDASFAMVPTVPQTQRQFDAMWEVYGPYLGENFSELTSTSHWHLWGRSSPERTGCNETGDKE